MSRRATRSATLVASVRERAAPSVPGAIRVPQRTLPVSAFVAARRRAAAAATAARDAPVPDASAASAPAVARAAAAEPSAVSSFVSSILEAPLPSDAVLLAANAARPREQRAEPVTRAVHAMHFELDTASDAERIQASVLAVTTSELWDYTLDRPVENGLLDTRLGAIARARPCATCAGELGAASPANECVGHFGHLELVRPVFTPVTLPLLALALTIFCVHCGELLVWGEARARALAEARAAAPNRERQLRVLASYTRRATRCRRNDDMAAATAAAAATASGNEPAVAQRRSCGLECPRIVAFPRTHQNAAKRPTPFTLVAEYAVADVPSARSARLLAKRDGVPFAVTAERARLALAHADAAACASLFENSAARARAFFAALTYSVLPVPPPSVRPFAVPPADRKAPHDRVRMLQAIIDANHEYARHLAAAPDQRRLAAFDDESVAESTLLGAYEALQFQVNVSFAPATYVPFAPAAVRERSLPDAKALGFASALGGKGGRVRSNLMGKRVDFSGRSVATPDPALSLDELGMPRVMARVLTLVEHVTAQNQARLTALVDAVRVAARRATRLPARRGVPLPLVFMDATSGAAVPPLAARAPLDVPEPEDAAREYDDANGVALAVLDESGARFDLRMRDARARAPGYDVDANGPLPLGYAVERTLRHGDVVVLNRQPTLHGGSMMAFYVRILSCATLRVSPEVCTSFNLDFDGDEINVHVPQSVVAREEARALLANTRNVLNVARNAAGMGLIQDELLGVRLLSLRDTLLARDEACALLYAAAGALEWLRARGHPDAAAVGALPLALPVPAVVHSRAGPRWTGKQLLSLVLPAHLCREGTPTADDSGVLVRRGVLLAGTLNKAQLGVGRGTFVHSAVLHASASESSAPAGGRRRVADLVDALKALSLAHVLARGFSMGIGELALDSSARVLARTADSERVRADVYARSDAEQAAALAAWLPMARALTSDAARDAAVNALEAKLLAAAARADDALGDFARKRLRALAPRNALLDMVAAGSKGNPTSVGQSAVGLGQSQRAGMRIVDTSPSADVPEAVLGEGTTSRRLVAAIRPSAARDAAVAAAWAAGSSARTNYVRVLPHLHDGAYPLGREGGQVRSSFFGGLTPLEFFLHAMAGRDGLIDTAVKTSETGYMARRFVKGLEGIAVAYDNSVRTSDGTLVARAATGAAERLLRKPFAEAGWTAARLAAALSWPDEPAESASVLASVELVRDAYLRNVRTDEGVLLYTPVAVDDVLVEHLSARRSVGGAASGDDTPAAAYERSRALHGEAEALAVPALRALVAAALARWRPLLASAVHAAELCVRLASRRLVTHWTPSRAELAAALEALGVGLRDAVAAPGEALGVLAAQSLGEFATQLTLNTFHLCGTSHGAVGNVKRLRRVLEGYSAAKPAAMRVEPSRALTAALEARLVPPPHALALAPCERVPEHTALEAELARDTSARTRLCVGAPRLLEHGWSARVARADAAAALRYWLLGAYGECVRASVEYDAFGEYVTVRAQLVADGAEQHESRRTLAEHLRGQHAHVAAAFAASSALAVDAFALPRRRAALRRVLAAYAAGVAHSPERVRRLLASDVYAPFVASFEAMPLGSLVVARALRFERSRLLPPRAANDERELEDDATVALAPTRVKRATRGAALEASEAESSDEDGAAADAANDGNEAEEDDEDDEDASEAEAEDADAREVRELEARELARAEEDEDAAAGGEVGVEAPVVALVGGDVESSAAARGKHAPLLSEEQARAARALHRAQRLELAPFLRATLADTTSASQREHERALLDTYLEELSMEPAPVATRKRARTAEPRDTLEPACLGDACAWAAAGRSCLSEAVLVLHLEREWFETAGMSFDECVTRVRAALGSVFSVWGYDPLAHGLSAVLQVRVRLCRERARRLAANARVLGGAEPDLCALVPASAGDIDEHAVLHAALPAVLGVPLVPRARSSTVLERRTQHTYSPVTGLASREALVLALVSTEYLGVLGAAHVNAAESTCSSPAVVAGVLGIEAAREAIVRELEDIVASNASYVDRSHLELVADELTRTGRYVPVTRFTMAAHDSDVLLGATFECQGSAFITAAVNGARSELTSPSASVMLGQELRTIGTGLVDVRTGLPSAFAGAREQLAPAPTAFMSQRERELRAIHAALLRVGSTSAAAALARRWTSAPLRLDFSMAPDSPSDAGGYAMPDVDDDDAIDDADVCMSPCAPTSPGRAFASPALPFSSLDRGLAMMREFGVPESVPFGYSPSSPAYSPSSPAYSPSSPAYSPSSPAYSPSSPAYSPSSPAYSPSSPAYSPSSPAYSPTSPAYSPSSPAYSSSSPAYSPTSPAYSPSSPAYSPTSPAYSPSSPAYSPTSPAYSPSSPVYSPTVPPYSPGNAQAYSPSSPVLSPAPRLAVERDAVDDAFLGLDAPASPMRDDDDEMGSVSRGSSFGLLTYTHRAARVASGGTARADAASTSASAVLAFNAPSVLDAQAAVAAAVRFLPRAGP